MSAELIEALRSAPASIRDATRHAGEDALRARPSDDEWSATEVLAHLRACADVWGSCIETILSEERPTIRAVNPRRWIEGTDYPEQEFTKSLRAFAGQRKRLVALLSGLGDSDWSRKATITGAGKPLTRTVRDYAAWLARHERPHVKQIARTVDGIKAQGIDRARRP